MGIQQVKANTPGRREATFDDFADLTKFQPEKNLVIIRKRKGGRNSQGKITVRHHGGGAKRYIRIVDYKRDKYDVEATVQAIEYDPGRGARLALLFYGDGEKRYIVAPADLKVGDKIKSSRQLIEIKDGNSLPLEFIPAGMAVSCVELEPGEGAKVARGAGNVVYVMGVEGKYAQLKMPSGEIRQVKKGCLCTVGRVSNADHRHISLGKAGRSRHLGIRPTVRGTAMNPADHPHGGGEGNQSIGLRHPKTIWGKPALGVKTRKKRSSNRLIVSRRPQRQ